MSAGLNQGTEVGKLGTKMVRGLTRPAFLNRCQPRITYSGHPIREIPWTLPYWTSSLCPECKQVIKARKFAEGKEVFMEKECPKHGYFRELISNDVDFYMDLFTFRFGDNRGVANPLVHGEPNSECPDNCGVCNMHHSPICMANVDLTNCDAVPKFAWVRTMLNILRNRRPMPCKVVQFSYKEPIIHLNFIQTVKVAREMGFVWIQVAIKENNMLDLNFAHQCKKAGLRTLNLQFNNVTDNVLQTIEVARQVGLKVVLAPTITRGINDDQVGSIVKFACGNADVVDGIEFRPVCFTEPLAEEERRKRRYTITHLVLDVEKQTDGMMPRNNWMVLGCTKPFSQITEIFTGKPAYFMSCHPDCGGGGYILINPEDHNDAKALCEFFNVREALVDLHLLSEKLRKKNAWGRFRARRALKKHFNKKKAPNGLTFKRLLGVMKGNEDIKKSYRSIFVAGMHFQDVYNYDTERARRCVIHQAGIDGKIYPFCTYNAGPNYREKLEANLL